MHLVIFHNVNGWGFDMCHQAHDWGLTVHSKTHKKVAYTFIHFTDAGVTYKSKGREEGRGWGMGVNASAVTSGYYAEPYVILFLYCGSFKKHIYCEC